MEGKRENRAMLPKARNLMARIGLRPSRWKIIHQIILIIGVMTIFLGVQGLMAFFNINRLQQAMLLVYDGNARKLVDVSRARLALEDLRNNYVSVLAGVSKVGLMSEVELNDIQTTLDGLKEFDPELTAANLTRLQTAREILGQPVSPANYERLYEALSSIRQSLTLIESNLAGAGLSALAQGENFSRKSQWETVAIMLVSVGVALLFGFDLSANILKPLKETVAATRRLATGDLSKDFRVAGCPEVGAVAEGLNQSISGLRELVRGIDRHSNDIVGASKELKEASAESGRSAAQVAAAMESLAQASTEQAHQIQQAVATINRLSDLVRQVSLDTEGIAGASRNVAQSAQLGQEVTGRVSQEIHELYHSTLEVSDVIDELTQTSLAISEITSMITGIADQTTLLALNASIEAARAGEHGKGFQVVASETGKLAEQSKQAAREIDGLVKLMRSRTEHAVEVIQQGTVKAAEGRKLVQAAEGTFATIFRGLSDTLEQIEAVAKSAREMGRSNEETIGAISAIAAISEESMAGTEEVAATAEEQHASAEQVTALADNLAAIAGGLKRDIALFRLG